MSGFNSKNSIMGQTSGPRSPQGDFFGNVVGGQARTPPPMGANKMDGWRQGQRSSLIGQEAQPAPVPGYNTPGVGPLSTSPFLATTPTPTTWIPEPAAPPQGTITAPGQGPQGQTGSGPNVIKGPVRTGSGGGTFIQSGSGTGGFGGYDPNSPPPGYDPDAWAYDSKTGLDVRTGKPAGITAQVLSDGRTIALPDDPAKWTDDLLQTMIADVPKNPLIHPESPVRQLWRDVAIAYRQGGRHVASLVARGLPLGVALSQSAATEAASVPSDPIVAMWQTQINGGGPQAVVARQALQQHLALKQAQEELSKQQAAKEQVQMSQAQAPPQPTYAPPSSWTPYAQPTYAGQAFSPNPSQSLDLNSLIQLLSRVFGGGY